MPKELKRNILSEEKKGSVLALLAEGYSEFASLKFQIQRFMRTRSNCRHWEQQSYWPAEGEKRLSTDRDDRQLIQMSLSIWWRIGDDLGVLQQGWNQEHSSLWREHESCFLLIMLPNSEDCFFQQDSAPCHTAWSNKVWMVDHKIKTLSWSANLQTWTPLKTSGMRSRGRWMATSHQTKPGCLNFCFRSGIMSPNSNVKDWWRAYEDTSKLWLKIRVISLNIDF